MNKQTRELIDSPDHCTLKEAAARVGIHPLTFKKYAARLGVVGVPVSKYTFYRREDVERIAKVVENNTPVWIQMIEHDTGRKVKEIIFDD